MVGHLYYKALRVLEEIARFGLALGRFSMGDPLSQDEASVSCALLTLEMLCVYHYGPF